MCKEGGFNITKFSNNHIEVLNSIPDEYRKDRMKDKDLNLGILAEDKALGVMWNIQEDILRFIIKMDDKPATWHRLLAALSNVYCNCGRPDLQTVCYTTDCNASCYNKIFTNKNIE